MKHASIRLQQRLGTYLSRSDRGGSGSCHDVSRLIVPDPANFLQRRFWSLRRFADKPSKWIAGAISALKRGKDDFR